jgi:hypothetical protein
MPIDYAVAEVQPCALPGFLAGVGREGRAAE